MKTNYKENQTLIQKVFPYSERSLQSFNQKQLNTLIEEALKSDEPYLSLIEAAEKIGATRETLTKKAQDGKVPAFRFNNRWFFKLSLLETYMPNSWQYEYFRQQALNEIAQKVLKEYDKIEDKNQRRHDILSDFLNGMSYEEVAEKNQLTRERIRQLISKTLTHIVRDVYFEKKKDIQELESLKKRNALLKRENLELKSGIVKRHKQQNTTVLDRDCDIEDITLSVRAYNALKAAKINTFLELKAYNTNELLRFRNVGRRTIREIEEIFEHPEKYIEKYKN